MEKFISDADDLAYEISAALEKTRIVSDDLYNDFFELQASERELILINFKSAALKHDIESDYLLVLDNKIKQLREIIQKMNAATKKLQEGAV